MGSELAMGYNTKSSRRDLICARHCGKWSPTRIGGTKVLVNVR